MSNLIKRENAWDKVDIFPIEGQRQWIQISASKEKECSAFLKKLDKHIAKNPLKNNVYGIQLNLSCPSPELIKIGQGPALIKRPGKIISILKELLKQDKYKVGIKVRLGLNALEVKQRRIITLFEELKKIDNPNFSRVTVHFKHAKDLSISSYDYSLLNELASFNLPMILNGGVKNSKDFNNILRNVPNRKSIVGLMLGREALRNPDCFIEVNKNLNGMSIQPRTPPLIKSEFERFCAQHPSKPIFLATIKKYCSWYA